MTNFEKLEEILGFEFKNKDILKEALTHRSYLNEHPSWPVPNNERLEYLGDAVLELAVTEYIYAKYPDFQEGKMTSLRAALVNHVILSKIAREELSLQKFILLSRGEAKDTGRAREVILANAIESVLGAVYLDRGYEVAKKLINEIVLTKLPEVMERGLERDPKSALQEILQEKMKLTPSYRILEEKGPDHQKEFLVGVFFGDKLIEKGRGNSKQEGEYRAAQNALEYIKEKSGWEIK
ncbi:MAG: ribonuclease III [Minisyncoccia bacterium]